MEICGVDINIGDYVEVEYTTGTAFKGRIIKGNITKMLDENSPDIEVILPKGFKQAQLNHGWCFHEGDKILKHSVK